MFVPTIARRPRRLIPFIAVALAVIILFVTIAVYLGDYYKPTETALAAMNTTETVTVMSIAGNATEFAPTDPTSAIVFYPGGKVDHRAYAPLMQELANRGILCVLMEMPFRLAVLDMHAAEGIPASIQDRYSTIESVYIAGHSLGGTMAAVHLADTAEYYDGLILLASYTTHNLSMIPDLRVLSIYGSEDGVLNRDAYSENISHLPADYDEIILDGGNHAGFGNYGAQSGDGAATMTAAEQIHATVDAIQAFMAEEHP